MARILIIEDEEALRITIVSTLRMHGFEVIEATNGKVGLEQFVALRPDAVVTDIVMPEKEGIETIMALKKLAPQVPIVAMSGSNHFDAYLRAARLLGVVETIAKPFSPERLLETVNRVLPQAPPTSADVRVLIVDDDPNGRFLTARRIRRELPTTTILEAEHAAQALELLATETVDLVLTDNGIGPKDGITMIRELRTRNFAKPIIMASMNPVLEQRALQAGATAFVFSGDAAEVIRLMKLHLRRT